MAEKVAKLGVKREKDFMYYIKGGAVWKVPRKQPGQAKGKSEKVHDAGVSQDVNYIYFLDKDGDVARAKRAIGGQKRKKTAAKADKQFRTVEFTITATANYTPPPKVAAGPGEAPGPAR